MEQKHGAPGKMMGLVREAVDAVPDLRFIVWPAIGIVATLAIVESLKYGWRVAVLGSIWVLLLALAYFVVNAIRRVIDGPNASSFIELPAKILVWFLTLAICGFVGMTMMYFFTGRLPELLSFRDPIVDASSVAPKQPPPVLQPVSTKQQSESTLSAPTTPHSANSIDRCLEAIGIDKSVRDVEMLARHCLNLAK